MSSPGLKLVLRIPPQEQGEIEAEGEENSEKDSHSAAITDENSNSLMTAPDDNSSSNALSDSGNNTYSSSLLPPLLTSEIAPEASTNASTGKKKRKKRRFKFTVPAQRMPKLKRKTDDKLEESENRKKVIVEGPGLDLEAESPGGSPDFIEPDYTPLQRLLDHMLTYFEKKDPENFFMNPVSDIIAPNYSTIIKQPMDFSTMRRKLNENEYKNLPEFQADVDLICRNATTYNDPGTIFYVASKKLETIKEYLFCKERLLFLQRTQNFMSQISEEELGYDLRKKPVLKVPKPPLTDYSCIVDDMSADDVFAQVSVASQIAREKLASRRPNCKTAFVNTKKDGTTTLKLLTAEKFDETRLKDESVDSGENSTLKNEQKERQFCLSDLIPKLKEGTPGLSKFEVHPADYVVPCNSLDYGPFASFAPTFDSTWSTLSKEDSDLLLSTFNNDETCVNYVDNVRRFIRGSGDELVKMVDGLLDALTEGEYSKQFNPSSEDELLEDINSVDEIESSRDLIIEENTGAPSLPSLSAVDSTLAENCTLLTDLHNAQHTRLSRPPPFVLTDAQGPSVHETQIAEQYLSNLQALASQVTPGDLVSAGTVRSFMTSAEPEDSNSSDEYDMEVFREFFQVENANND